jgi:RHS repeat-associated protein
MGTVAAQGSFRFQSDLTDALTGQVDMLTRMYEPTLGRFSVRDPLMGTPTEPVSLNQYVYGQMNPVSLSDPTGLRPECGDCTRAAEQKGIDEWASHSAEHPIPDPSASVLYASLRDPETSEADRLVAARLLVRYYGQTGLEIVQNWW